MPRNPKVYMDFTIGSKAAGRVVFELYTDITPKTAENFRGLCTGEYGQAKLSRKKLHYLGCKVHRIVDDFVIQAGDIVNADGSGGESIYGTKHFPDENFTRRHAHAGLLSMANQGRDTNSSQFFITLKPAPHLDGKHVVFGQVISGIEVVRAIARVPTDLYEHPRIPVHIFDCGQLDDQNRPMRGGSGEDLLDQESGATTIDHGTDAVAEYEKLRQKKLIPIYLNLFFVCAYEYVIRGKLEAKKVEESQSDEEEEEVKQAAPSDKIAQKKLELQMKMNEARKLNNKAVVEEQERLTDPTFEKRKNKEELFREKKSAQDALTKQGLTKDKAAYAFEQAAQAEKVAMKKKKRAGAGAFGWDVFNEDSLYSAYYKRVKKFEGQGGNQSFRSQNHSHPFTTKEKGDEADLAAKMAADVEAQIERRGEFRRERMTIDSEKDIDYINDRNKVFNEKLERNFSKYHREHYLL